MQVDLPIGPEIVLLDIAFTPADPNHGALTCAATYTNAAASVDTAQRTS